MYGEEKEKIEVRVRVIFQNPNPKMLRPFRFRLSRSDPPGGPTSVSRAPIDPKTKPSRESFSKVQYFGQKSQFSCFIWHQNRPFFTFSFPSQLFGPSRRVRVRVIFQNTNPKMLRPFRHSLSRSDPPGGPTNVFRSPIGPRTKPSRESIIAGFGCIKLFSVLYYPPRRTRPA